MRRWHTWYLLIPALVVFWVIFAIVLIISGIPFFVVTMALTTLLVLSLLVLALAWAYTHNF